MGVIRAGAVVVAALAMSAFAAGHGGAVAQEAPEESSLLLIMDASSSMLAEDVGGQSRMAAAREALHDVVASLPDELAVGLRVFGANEDDTDREVGCTDTELVVPVAALDRGGLSAAIDEIEPRGFTPISESLRQAAGDLPDSGARTIVLVSDGIDTCGPPPPCEVAQELIADGIEVTIQTVGFALGGERQAEEDLRCIADATGGEYREAADAAELASAMTVLSARAANLYETSAMPIEGATIFRDAPVLELERSYLDSIVQGESRWYAYELAEGQQLASVEILQTGGGDGRGGMAQVLMHDERGSSVSSPRFYVRAESTPEVTSAWTYADVTGPGTFYVEIADHSLEDNEEVEFEIAIFADGEPVDTATGDPTASPEPDETADTGEPTAEDSPAAGDETSAAADSSDGGTVWMVVAAALLVVVIALLATLVVVLRRGAQS